MNMMPQMPMGGMPMMPPPPPPISQEAYEEAKLIADVPTWEEVAGVLRTDDRRNYSIDVETTATMAEQDIEEKRLKIEYVTATTQMLQQAIPVAQGNAKLVNLMKELTMFGASAFNIGRTLEETLEDAFDAFSNAEPQPSPEAQKLQAEMQMKDKELQASMAEKQADAQIKAKESQQKLQFEAAKFGLDKQKAEMELQFKQQEMGFKQRELEMKAQSDAVAMQMQQDGARFEQGMKSQEFEDKRQASMFDRQAKQEESQFQRGMQEREFAGKSEDLAYRRQMDADAMKGPDGKAPRDAVVAQVEALVQQVGEAVGQLSEQQMMIAKALQGLAQQQSETTDAMTAVVSHMTSPVSVKRDPATRRAIGVERGPNDAKDMRAMLEKLAQGRNLVRGADNRIEAFA